MAFFVNCLVESARKLLHRVNQDLLSFAIHLETFGKGVGLTFNHTLACKDHVVLDLKGEHIDFASRLIIRLQNGFFTFIFHLFLHGVLHDTLQRLHFIAFHFFKLISPLLILDCS